MMKSKIVEKNLKWALCYQVVTLLLGFITPRFIILVYGSEVNGLQSAIMQILNILTLLQAGSVSATVYLLYRPFAIQNYDDVSFHLYSAIRFFRKISLLFFIIMTTGACIFAFTMKGSICKIELFFAFFILGAKSALDMLLTTKYVTIFSADQNKYIISIANLIEKIVYYFLMYLTIVGRIHFIVLYIDLVLGCIAKLFFYRVVFDNKYKLLINTKKKYNYTPIKGRNFSMINEIAHSVAVSSIAILFSYLYGLSASSVFSVYNLALTMLMMIGIVLYESFAPSFGHLITERNVEKINQVFSTFTCGFNIINLVMYMCVAFLIIPFVKIYTTGMNDAEYINKLLGLLTVLFGLIYTFRIPFNILVSTSGLFKETSMQPFVFSLISVFISIILGKIRMEFILIGPIVFYIANFLYQKNKLKKLLPEMRLNGKWDQYVISILGVLMSALVSYTFIDFAIGIVKLVMFGIIWFVISTTYALSLYSFNNRAEILHLFNYAKARIYKAK